MNLNNTEKNELQQIAKNLVSEIEKMKKKRRRTKETNGEDKDGASKVRTRGK